MKISINLSRGQTTALFINPVITDAMQQARMDGLNATLIEVVNNLIPSK